MLIDLSLAPMYRPRPCRLRNPPRLLDLARDLGLLPRDLGLLPVPPRLPLPPRLPVLPPPRDLAHLPPVLARLKARPQIQSTLESIQIKMRHTCLGGNMSSGGNRSSGGLLKSTVQ